MNPPGVRLGAATRALLWMGWRRLWNRLTEGWKRPVPGERGATARKRGAGVLLLAFAGLALLFAGFIWSARFVGRLVTTPDGPWSVSPVTMAALRQLDHVRDPDMKKWRVRAVLREDERNRRSGWPADDADLDARLGRFLERGSGSFSVRHVEEEAVLPGSWPEGEAGRRASVRLAAMVTAIAMVLALLAPGDALRDPAAAGRIVEWLHTLPVPARTLAAARAAAGGLGQLFAWWYLLPLCATAAWAAGARWSALPIGIFLTLCLAALTGAIRLVVETLLRTVVPPSRQRGAHALVGLGAMLANFVVLLVLAAPRPPDWAAQALDSAPAWVSWTPGGLPALAITGGWTGFAAGALLLGQAVLLLAGAGWLVAALDARGLTTGGSGRGRAAPGPGPRTAFHRECLVLLRNRALLVQTLVVPVAVVGVQLAINASGTSISALVGADFRHVAALVFYLVAYLLSFGAIAGLAVEGPGLWQPAVLPGALPRLLVGKMLWWTLLGMAYATVALLAAAWVLRPGPRHLDEAFLVLLGVPLHAALAVAMAVFAADPFADRVDQRFRPVYSLIFLAVSGLYALAIYHSSIWVRSVQVLLTASLALALWQRAQEALPYLLDPSARPPRTLGASDGLLAALAFLVVQGGIGLLLALTGLPADQAMFWAFTSAGVLVACSAMLILWRAGMADVWREVGLARDPAGKPLWAQVLIGGSGGIVAGVIGLGFLLLVASMPWLKEQVAANPDAAWPGSWSTMVGVAVVMAPLCEEFIFRGLLFGGLRRSLPAWGAVVVSAGFFAAMHPPLAAVPVFFLGAIAAIVYRWGGSLLPAIVAHALYNAIMMVVPQLATQLAGKG